MSAQAQRTSAHARTRSRTCYNTWQTLPRHQPPIHPSNHSRTLPCPTLPCLTLPYPTPGKLKITHMNTGGGQFPIKNGVQIATVKSDEEDHPSGVTVTRTTQTLYQTAAIRKLTIQGSGFNSDTDLTFDPPLVKGTDYSQVRERGCLGRREEERKGDERQEDPYRNGHTLSLCNPHLTLPPPHFWFLSFPLFHR